MLLLLPCLCVFGVFGQLPPQPLSLFWSPLHQDNVNIATEAGASYLDASYSFVDDNLFVVSNTTQLPGTVPLNHYWNAALKHSYVTASPEGNAFAIANNYSFLLVEGYVLPASAGTAQTRPLEMWYSAARGDHFLVGTPTNRANAISANYVFLFVDCVIPIAWTLWPNTPPADIPFQKSADLLDFEFGFGLNAIPPGIGADTWYPSWSRDGNLYSSWTDGTVNGVSSDSGGDGATTGMAIVVGDDPFNLSVSGPRPSWVSSAAPYQGRYPSGNLHYNGTWYYATYSLENYEYHPSVPVNCGNWCIQGPFCWWRYSNDSGLTWVDPHSNMSSFSDNLFQEVAVNNSKVKFGAPHVVDFGQEMEHSPDGKFYLVGHGASEPNEYQSWMQGSQVYMARGIPTPATINDATQYEFYAGGSGSNAIWSSSIGDAAPLFTWGNRTGVVTLSYHPLLSKYIMVIGTSTFSPSMVTQFDTYFLESDDLTGPWSYVTYLSEFGPEAYFVNIPSKFMGLGGGVYEDTAAPFVAAAWGGDAAATANNKTSTFQDRTRPASNQESQGYYNFFLSYSANFAERPTSPLPPGSGYHWSLQQSRFSLSAAFLEKLRSRA